MTDGKSESARVRATALKLLQYCASNDFSGYDPYDALNSRLFQALPILDFKFVRLALTQGIKRSPMNFRPLLLVPKTRNAKGLALFVAALVRLSRLGLLQDGSQIGSTSESLLGMASKNETYSCWGYNFDWQTRTCLVPRGLPNIICTTFAANALLDAYEHKGCLPYKEAAVSAAEFILRRLYTQTQDAACFNYTSLEPARIHNANLLGAALLCRVANCNGSRKFIEPALRAARFSASQQNADGSWHYGQRPWQKWVDNFHTGFNLCALMDIGRFSGSTEFESALTRGFEYYLRNFFEPDGAPRYFSHKTYPLDIHSAAQSIITLLALNHLDSRSIDLAYSVLEWALEHMWDEGGYFYYQKHRYWTDRISYMRWSQAWMLLALASVLEHNKKTEVRRTRSALECF